ncbi:cell wall-binding repeat-containing protein [Desulfosporosinus sp. OT]|uniref:cell wall-binding repeat-containing protein n=1 Tax=Desulfosporosinus sp. OT TaxID=913865 RepID=UPI0002239F65|nr:cell wall-binding repeat-containing protein [Desulfosporosinus sp. OT]EGW40812.1 hypothetical protein DOT_1280 [Desulfosporosinus sp. OT]
MFIVGGTGVVSGQIEENLKSRNIQVIRLAGITQYDTSAAAANYLGPSEQVFVVSGENVPDAPCPSLSMQPAKGVLYF